MEKVKISIEQKKIVDDMERIKQIIEEWQKIKEECQLNPDASLEITVY